METRTTRAIKKTITRHYRKRQSGEVLARLTINMPQKDKEYFEQQAKARGITVSGMVTDAALNTMKGVVIITFKAKRLIRLTLKKETDLSAFLRIFYSNNSGDVISSSGMEIVLEALNLFFLPYAEEMIGALSISYE